jgi:hypothetical protein
MPILRQTQSALLLPLDLVETGAAISCHFEVEHTPCDNVAPTTCGLASLLRAADTRCPCVAVGYQRAPQAL